MIVPMRGFSPPPGVLIVPTIARRDVCWHRFPPGVDRRLFDISEQTQQHFVDVLNRVYKRATPTLEESFIKRLFLYLGVLLNDVSGAALQLVTHENLRMTQPMIRNAHEYTVRALYYSHRRALTYAHFTELFPKAERLWGSVPVDSSVMKTIDGMVERFEQKNPEWKRPHEPQGPQSLFLEMYGEARGRRLYDRWHKFYSPFTHGTFDGVMFVLAHDGNNTVVKPGADISNIVLAEITRIVFSMTALMKRVFDEQDTTTLPLFREYVKRIDGLHIRVQAPLPVPRLTFCAKQ